MEHFRRWAVLMAARTQPYNSYNQTTQLGRFQFYWLYKLYPIAPELSYFPTLFVAGLN